jgi:sigma-B regulation protein RsbU (phosphoserine phosphatase)
MRRAAMDATTGRSEPPNDVSLDPLLWQARFEAGHSLAAWKGIAMVASSCFPPSDHSAVIVVDDARFSCEMIRRVLKGAGFQDIRIAHAAQEVLDMMRQRKADILIADWLMPEVDGLNLTQQVRQFDEEANHYTYVVLMTAKEGQQPLLEAFDRGVDDFISKSPDSTQLLARIRAAGRISKLQSDLIKANRRLAELNRHLEESHCFDSVTGLGNRSYLERQTDNSLRHMEARGGAACLAIIRINDFELLRDRHGDRVCDDIVEATATRLQQSVRPLDIVVRLAPAEFGLLMQQQDDSRCHGPSFRRVYQVLNLRAYKTSAGFVTAASSVCLCSVVPTEDRPAPGEIIEFVRSHLDAAQQSGEILEVHWPAATVP